MSRPLRAMLMPELVGRVHEEYLNRQFKGPVLLSDFGAWLWNRNTKLPELMPFLVGIVAWVVSVGGAVLLFFRGHVELGYFVLIVAVPGGVALPVVALVWSAMGTSDLYRGFGDAAADLADEMEERVSVQCPQCGGHTDLVLVGGREQAPCPWCDAPLELPKEQPGWVQAAARDLEKKYAGSFDAHVASIYGRRAPGALASGRRLPSKGYEYEGSVVFGSARGFPVREYAEDAWSYTPARVTELVASTRLPGEALWTRPERAADVCRAASQLRVRLPQLVNGRVDSRGWLHETSPRFRFPYSPELTQVLERLGPHGALLIDPGGITAFRFKGGVQVTPDSRMAAFHDELAALVLALGASSPRPGGSTP